MGQGAIAGGPVRNRRLTNIAVVAGTLQFLIAGFVRHEVLGAVVGVLLALTPWAPWTTTERAR